MDKPIAYFALIMIFTTACANIFAQQADYIEMREELTYLSCIKVSTDTIDLSLTNLLSVNVDSIDTNLSHYYYDLGWAYFYKANSSKNDMYRDLSDLAYFKCISVDSNYVSAYWNLALRYSHIGECHLSRRLLDEYVNRCEKGSYDPEAVQRVISRCN